MYKAPTTVSVPPLRGSGVRRYRRKKKKQQQRRKPAKNKRVKKRKTNVRKLILGKLLKAAAAR